MKRLAVAAVLLTTITNVHAKGDVEGDDLVVVEAAPLAETVAPMKPTWCDLATSDSYSTGAMSRAIQRAIKDGWNREITQEVAEAVCVSPDLPGYQKQTAYVVQAWVNMTGMSVSEVVESIRARMNKDAWDKGHDEICAGVGPTADASKFDRAVAGAVGKFYGCDYHKIPQWMENNTDDVRYVLEGLAAPPSPILQVYEVRQCLTDNSDLSYGDLFNYAVCRPAANRLDRAAFYKYVDDAKLNVYAKAIARESFAVAKLLDARLAVTAKSQAAKDAAFEPIFTAGEKAWATWEKLRADNAAAFDAAYKYRAAFYGNSKKARAACFDGLRDQFAAAIAARKPKTLDEAKAAHGDSLGFNLSLSLMLCAAADGQGVYSNLLVANAPNQRPTFGPRSAAYYAVVNAINDVLADRDRFAMKPGYFFGDGKVNYDADASYVREKDCYGSPVESIVEKSEKKGDFFKVTFKKKSYVADVVSCKETGRIERIDPGGQVIYRQDCTITGQQTVNDTEDPLMVPGWTAKGLTKGGLARFYCSSKQAEGVRLCIPTAAFADKEAKKLTNYLGVEVK